MKQSYLEVTYRHGRPMAAYYYLPRRAGQHAWRSREASPGLVVDLARSGQPIGIEITEPTRITLAAINRLLRQLDMPLMSARDLSPVRAA